MHLGSDNGGNSAAVIYSLIGTAKLNGINPQDYLRHVLQRIADHPINRIDELLPWAVATQLNRKGVTDSSAAEQADSWSYCVMREALRLRTGSMDIGVAS